MLLDDKTMSRALKVAAVVLLGPLIVTTGCSESSRNQKSQAIVETLIPVSERRDDLFDLSLHIIEVPSNRILETRVLHTNYVANNTYDVEGHIAIEDVSIIHDDGTLLARALVNHVVNLPPNEIVSDAVDLPIQIADSQKFEVVLDAFNKALGEMLDQKTEIGDSAAYDALERVEPEFMYEVTLGLKHPVRPPWRRRIRF